MAEPLSDEIVQKAIRYAQSGNRTQEDRDFLVSVITLLQHEWRLANEQVVNQMMRVEMVEEELNEATRLLVRSQNHPSIEFYDDVEDWLTNHPLPNDPQRSNFYPRGKT